MVEPYDDDGHVITTVLSVVTDCLGTAHVQYLFAQVGQDHFVSSRP